RARRSLPPFCRSWDPRVASLRQFLVSKLQEPPASAPEQLADSPAKAIQVYLVPRAEERHRSNWRKGPQLGLVFALISSLNQFSSALEGRAIRFSVPWGPAHLVLAQSTARHWGPA